MTDRPTARELLEAVSEFLTAEVLPTAADHRFKFRTLVAVNALGIASREIESADQGAPEEELRELAMRIRMGEIHDEDLGQLKEHVAAKLRISNPGYLERYR